jgi:hypothetical protein
MPDWHKQNLTHFASVKKMVDQALSLEGPHALDPVEAWRLRPVSEGIMQAYSDARTGDPEAINRLCRHLAAAYSSLTAGPSAKRFFTEEGVRLQQNVLGPLEMRLGKAKKAAQKKEKQRKTAPSIAAAIRAVAEDRGTPLEKLLVTRISFIRDHVIGSVNKVLAARKLPLATESDVAFTIKEMLLSAL